MNNLSYSIDFSVRPVNIFQTINQQINQVTTNTQKMTNNFGDSWKQLLTVNQALEGIRNLKSILDGAIEPGVALNTSLADLSAITGLTGKALGDISEAARASAIAFGTDAAQNVESYKLLLSQLSPDIAKNADALKLMGDYVNILSKTMGGNTVAATEVLTTAMNQYGVSLDNPMQASKTMAEMMNVMAAAAKEGSAELPQIKAALENVGMVAKTTGVTFSETNAAIQVLDKAGKKGAEGGVALRNTLSILSEGRFLPKQTRAALEEAGINISQLADRTTPLTTRLNALKPIISDTALITKLFGKENAAAAIALINGTESIDDYNQKIRGTNTAVDQAKVIMGSYAEGVKGWKVWLDDFKISMFNSAQGILAYKEVVFQAGISLGQLFSGYNALSSFMDTKFAQSIYTSIKGLFIKTTVIQADTSATALNAVATSRASLATKAWTAIQRIFNATMAANPVGFAIKAVALLTAGVIAVTAAVSAYNKNQDTAKTIANELNSQILIEKRGLNDLFEQLKRTNPASQRRKELIEEMNSRYPGLLDYQKLETASEKEIEKARRQANDELERGIIISSQRAQKEAFYKKTGEKELELSNSLFKSGSTENQVGEFLSAIDKITEETVKAGKYKPGFLFGSSTDLNKDIYHQLRANPKFKNIFGDHKSSGEIIDLIDTKLSGYNEIAERQKYLEIKLGKKKSAEASTEETDAKSTPGIKPLKTGKANLNTGFGKKAADSAKGPFQTEKLGGTSASQAGHSSGNRSLTINKLVETLIVKVERLPESKERIKDAVAEALLTAVNDYNLAT